MDKGNHQIYPWEVFLSELIGTAVLLFVGMSLVIFMGGTGSPVVQAIPDIGVRRLITGFLFGSTGALIAISRIGKVSGAHLNPVVTLAFWLMGKLDSRTSLKYVYGQLAGCIIGCLPLFAWGSMGRSVAFGATTPGVGYTLETALLGEMLTTLTMVILLAVFLAFRPLRPYTPALFPFLYSVMVYLESAISGTSTNPARSLGPAVVSGHWEGWWIYWVGPVAGALVGTLAISFLARRITVAKLYAFDSQNDLLFRRKAGGAPEKILPNHS